MVMLAAAPIAAKLGRAAVARALAKKMGKRAGVGGPKRRRRRGLDGKLRGDLLWIKNNIGKTAAANYLAGKLH